MYWLLLVPAVLLLWGIAEAQMPPKIRRHRCGDRGITILWIADLHCSRWTPPAKISRLVRRITALNPDLIFLGGDYADRGLKYITPCIQRLAELNPDAAVLGNHDVQTRGGVNPRQAVVAAIEQQGIPLIYNSSRIIEQGPWKIQLAGPADCRRDVAYLGHIARDSSADLLIILSHNPDCIPTGCTHLPFDLAVCGHTHGGQITCFGRPVTTHSIYRKKLGRGMCTFRGKPVVVSSGVGTTILPLRFFSPPGIELIEL